MKILPIQQRSEEWLSLRRTKITATDCAVILRESRWKTPLQLYREKHYGNETKITPAMQKGIDLEDEARSYFEEKLGMKFLPLVALSDTHPWQMASLDGWCEDSNTLLEIKVVGERTFRKVEAGDIPSEYGWQCHHQMAVAEKAEKAILAFYYKPQDRLESLEICIHRDEGKIIELTQAESVFYNDHLLSFVEPPYIL